MKLFWITAMSLAMVAVALADKVTLKDGRTYEGVVLEDTDTTVKIKTAKATLTFQKDQVTGIEKGAGGALQERETKLAALDPAKPQGYLDAANWMTGKGSDAYDLPTLRRLCAAASKLDAKLAYDAQMLLGKKLEEAGMKREAATAYARSQVAKPGDAEARTRLENLKAGLHDDSKKEMEQLAAALDLVAAGSFAEALPKLQKADSLAMAEKASEFMGMSMESLTKDVASRVQCKTCGGSGETKCPGCDGNRVISCMACGGSGNKKGFTAGKEQDGISGSVCRTCFGCGSTLCQKCKAERDITIRFKEKVDEDDSITVHAKAGHEADALKSEIELINYTHKSLKCKVIGIKGEPPTGGGMTPCGTCQGVKYNPPAAKLPIDKIRLFMEEIHDRIGGQKPYDDVPAVTEVYDRNALADGCLRYKDGKWLK